MTGPAGCPQIRLALGVYVLGAIDPADRAVVDAHVATCGDCREELAGLAGLPALLHRIPAAEAQRLAAGPGGPAPDETAPGDLLPAVLARVARVRRARRRRGLVAAAAVAAAALVAGAAGAAMLGGGPPAAPPAVAGPGQSQVSWQTVSGADPATGVHLTVKYAPMPWGTTIAAMVTGIQPGTVCQFVVTGSGGRRWVVGGWRVGYQRGPVWYPASTSLTAADLRAFEVTAAGAVLVTAHAP